MSAAATAFGLVVVGELNIYDEFWLWPENEKTFEFWQSVQSQWNISDERPRGMNYPALLAVMEMKGIPKKKRPPLFLDLQVMEAASLDEWARDR